MAPRTDHKKFHAFLKEIQQYIPDKRIVWREDTHCNICDEITQPEKILPTNHFLIFIVVFVGRLNYLIYLMRKINRHDNAGLFLEDLFVGLYVETIIGINQHAPSLLKEKEIEYNEEQFRKISELRNSAFHFPDDTKLFNDRRTEYNEFARANIHPFNENTKKLVQFARKVVDDNPNVPEVIEAWINANQFGDV